MSNRVSIERLLPTLVWIETHLDDDLSLEALARVEGLSPHHFHRLFRTVVGETAKQYVQRLRLERGAFLLTIEDRRILEIALDVGFRSHETFTRAFRRRFDIAPSVYRKQRRSEAIPAENGTTSSLESLRPTGELSKTSVRHLSDMPVAFIRHHGAYEDVPPQLWDELMSWAEKSGHGQQHLLLGIGHDAPGITPTDRLRFDACVRVPRRFAGDGRIGCQTIPGGYYAMTTHVGPYDSLAAAWAEVFGRVMALKRYTTPGLPVLEIYQATRIDPRHILNRTELCLPLMSRATQLRA